MSTIQASQVERSFRSVQRSTPDIPAPDRAKIPPNHFQEEHILMASFVIEELRLSRLTNPFLTARRTDLYEG